MVSREKRGEQQAAGENREGEGKQQEQRGGGDKREGEGEGEEPKTWGSGEGGLGHPLPPPYTDLALPPNDYPALLWRIIAKPFGQP